MNCLSEASGTEDCLKKQDFVSDLLMADVILNISPHMTIWRNHSL